MGAQKPLVLIVGEDDDIHHLFDAYLCAFGFEVTHVFDGIDAVEVATLLLPDIVVMDFDLPGRSGCQAAELLKTIKRTSNIPIVLMTAHAERRHRALARRAGCDGFLVQPCSPAQLHQAIVDGLLAMERAAPRTGRLLLVEDDSVVRQAMHEALEEEGYEVADAVNGLEALRHLRGRNPRPDLILLDLIMPVIDGWEFRRLQRDDDGLAAIPVVALTGVPACRRAPLDVSFCLDKPLHLANLFATIEKALSRKNTQRTAGL